MRLSANGVVSVVRQVALPNLVYKWPFELSYFLHISGQLQPGPLYMLQIIFVLFYEHIIVYLMYYAT